jgi:hypothetical protein
VENNNGKPNIHGLSFMRKFTPIALEVPLASALPLFVRFYWALQGACLPLFANVTGAENCSRGVIFAKFAHSAVTFGGDANKVCYTRFECLKSWTARPFVTKSLPG